MIDTSVVIDLDLIDADQLPSEMVVAAITLAELAAGPHAARDQAECSIRQERLQRMEAGFSTLPFDANAARAFGRIAAAEYSAGLRSRARFGDYLIAATALAAELPLYTRNPQDFALLNDVIEIVAV